MAQSKHNYTGFTVIELVMVIVIIAILATSVAPKFIGVNHFNAQTYRDQMISSLRLMQQKAMQDTRDSQCHRIVVMVHGYGAAEKCDSNSLISDWQNQNTGFQFPDDTVEITDYSGSLTFDSWGRVEECATGCSITMSSGSQASLCIESEGYIHVC